MGGHKTDKEKGRNMKILIAKANDGVVWDIMGVREVSRRITR